MAVGEPVRPAGNAFKFYDPKATVNSGNADGRIGGEKTFEYVAIPEPAGQRENRSVRIALFRTGERTLPNPREHGRSR